MNIAKGLVIVCCGGLLLCACHRGGPPPPCQNLPVSAEDQTRAVQQALAGRRFDVGPVDGRMNSQTVAALRSFQNYTGLPESGQTDARTLEALGFCAVSPVNNRLSRECVEFPTDRRGQLQAVQQILSERGYDPGPAGGAMGKKTREALKRFQADKGLSETGKVDAATRGALGFCGESTDGKAKGGKSTSGKSKGDKSAAVPPSSAGDPQLQEVQRELTARGYDPGPADGRMGEKTREALKRFQIDNGLVGPSGNADAKTLGVLRSSASTAATPEKTSLGPGKADAVPAKDFHEADLQAPSEKKTGDLALPPPPTSVPASSAGKPNDLTLPPPASASAPSAGKSNDLTSPPPAAPPAKKTGDLTLPPPPASPSASSSESSGGLALPPPPTSAPAP